MQIVDGQDKFGRKYKYIIPEGKHPKPSKVYLITLTYNFDDYLDYCLNAVKDQVDGIYAIDNGSTDQTLRILDVHGAKWIQDKRKGDLSYLANKVLQGVPLNSWVFYVNPDEILFDMEKQMLGRYCTFLKQNKIYCADPSFPDFVYNYGTLNAHFDWGDGPGNYWTARRLFYWTGEEKFRHPTHFNITNTQDPTKGENEHRGEWSDTVAKLPYVTLFHYGKLRGIEKQRGKDNRLMDGEKMATGQIATIPYKGPHPTVMNLV